jgi:phosphatidylglycerophosphate synthase
LVRFGLAYLIVRELPDKRVEGVALLLLLLLTDIFDGMIARQMDCVTRFGAWLDLLTDNIVVLIFYFWQYVSTKSILNLYSWLVMTVVTVFFLFLPYIMGSGSGNKKLILNRIGYILVISAVFGILLQISYMNYFMAGIPLFLLLISVVIGWKPQVQEEKKRDDLQLIEKTG